MNVLTINCQEKDAPALFTKSLKETGFAVMTHHPLTKELITQTYLAWERFFNSPEKMQYAYDVDHQDGFFSTEISETAKGYGHKDIKEYYHFYPWGRQPPSVAAVSMEVYTAMSEFAATLLGWLEDHTPAHVIEKLSMPLRSMIPHSPKTLLRVIHYPPFTGDEAPGAVRAAAHEDVNLITLLPAATASGLQVQDTEGKWHEVSCDPGQIVVNGADMLTLCTNGYYPSATHRVVNPEGAARHQSRLSMPLFLHPRNEVRLSPTHTASKYLNERLVELGVK